MPSIVRTRPMAPVSVIIMCIVAAALVRAAVDRSVFVSVLDDKGQPVDGLTVKDFEVREDGVAREVLRVDRATEPLQIALLIDDSAAAERFIKQFRDGAKAFVNTITAAGRNQIAVITVGERSTLVLDYTTDAAALAASIDRIFPRSGSGMQLLDGIIDAAKGLAKREDTARKHIVIMMTEGIEFSTEHEQTVVDALYRAGATMHALVLTAATASDMAQEVRTRNVVLDVGTRTTGGRRDTLLAEMSIEGAFASLARELLSQYRVVFSRPDTLIPPEKLSVRATRPGLTVRARTRAEK
ncbi:MAG: VWA domain-containing protein [Vicinamibacterales bacterium]